MSHRENKLHPNVRFNERCLDEEMEGIFDSSSRMGLPTLTEEDQIPGPVGHFDESDYQLHRKESFPLIHNPLKPMYARGSHPKRRRAVSVPVGPNLAELQEPRSGTSSTLPEHADSPPKSSGSKRKSNVPSKVEFYIEEETGISPEPSEHDLLPELRHFPPSDVGMKASPSSKSVEAQAFLSQSTEDPIPSTLDRHKVDGEDSSVPLLSARASIPGDAVPDVAIVDPSNKLPVLKGTDDAIKENDPNKELSPEEKPRKTSRGHSKHHKGRRPSKQEDPSWRQRIGSELDFEHHQFMPTEPEEASMLPTADLDDMTSHRFEEIKGMRRYRIPTKSSIVAMSSGKEFEGAIFPPLKKHYDHRPHRVFVQLNELHELGNDVEWKERSRFIKYEEDVEESGDRWGKPHVASLSFHSLLNLRICLERGAVMLDLNETDLPGIYGRIIDSMIILDKVKREDRNSILGILMLRHKYVYEFKYDFMQKKNFSHQNLHAVQVNASKNEIQLAEKVTLNNEHGVLKSRKSELQVVSSSDDVRKHDTSILKRIPEDAEAISVDVGAVDFLSEPAVAFVRLAEGQHFPGLTEVSIPVRFFFILLGPTGNIDMDYYEIGRSISTLMINTRFHEIAYRASERKELLSGINEFLDESIVLPPGDWEKQSLLGVRDIQKKSDNIKRRKSVISNLGEVADISTILSEKRKQESLVRTGRCFGGLINEVKARYGVYKSDILDAFNMQCLATILFMFFANLAGGITFGGLYADKTDNLIGVSETLILDAFSGMVFSLFAGQPLAIIAANGPLLLLDESLYKLCLKYDVDFLSLRVWVSIWMLIIGVTVAAFEGSILVKYFTRFTQDIFAALISLLYIYDACYKLYGVYLEHPLRLDYCPAPTIIYSTPTNSTDDFDDINDDNGTLMDSINSYVGNSTVMPTVKNMALPTHLDGQKLNQPNTALLSTILMLGTFFIAFFLRHFRNSKFLGRSARRALGDFGVPIAIVLMVSLDLLLHDTYTLKLRVPVGLSPSNASYRGWLIPPMGVHSPIKIWQIFAAFLPALLLFILVFMQTEICDLLLCRKLKKGSGFHLDLVILTLINIVSGFIGGPWTCAATVRSLAHVSSLTIMSRTHAPGEVPKIVEIKEQRITAFFVGLLIGLSVLMAPALSKVPVAVLFGVFLYMGVSSCSGSQFFERVSLILMPAKHHPDVPYVHRVRTLKMHLYTFIQILCLIVLWIVKSTEAALSFPFFLLLLIPVRNQLKRLFSKRELNALDCDEAEPDNQHNEPDFYDSPMPT
ncbi:SLC4A3 (predicted) [Pycnogonum litorale]